MNCNDRFDNDPAGNPRKDGVTLTVPVHKIVNWYRDWRIRKTKLDIDKIEEYEDVVRDYKQDLDS
jgi:hypothetical protein